MPYVPSAVSVTTDLRPPGTFARSSTACHDQVPTLCPSSTSSFLSSRIRETRQEPSNHSSALGNRNSRGFFHCEGRGGVGGGVRRGKGGRHGHHIPATHGLTGLGTTTPAPGTKTLKGCVWAASSYHRTFSSHFENPERCVFINSVNHTDGKLNCLLRQEKEARLITERGCLPAASSAEPSLLGAERQPRPQPSGAAWTPAPTGPRSPQHRAPDGPGGSCPHIRQCCCEQP